MSETHIKPKWCKYAMSFHKGTVSGDYTIEEKPAIWLEFGLLKWEGDPEFVKSSAEQNEKLINEAFEKLKEEIRRRGWL